MKTPLRRKTSPENNIELIWCDLIWRTFWCSLGGAIWLIRLQWFSFWLDEIIFDTLHYTRHPQWSTNDIGHKALLMHYTCIRYYLTGLQDCDIDCNFKSVLVNPRRRQIYWCEKKIHLHINCRQSISDDAKAWFIHQWEPSKLCCS